MSSRTLLGNFVFFFLWLDWRVSIDLITNGLIIYREVIKRQCHIWDMCWVQKIAECQSNRYGIWGQNYLDWFIRCPLIPRQLNKTSHPFFLVLFYFSFAWCIAMFRGPCAPSPSSPSNFSGSSSWIYTIVGHRNPLLLEHFNSTIL